MARVWLYLPVCLLSLPLAVYLLAHSSRSVAHDDLRAVTLNEEGPLPSAAQMEDLARTDPIKFLENCLRRYDREVQGYSGTMQKHERIDGTLYPEETIAIQFREHPFSVFMRWLQGARRTGPERALYVEGENKGQTLARPFGVAARILYGDIVHRDVDGPDARRSGRYTLKEFGIRLGTVRTLVAWQAARDAGRLHFDYQGLQPVPQAGNRLCYVLHRTTERAEDDGVTDVTIAVDRENWLQVGSVLQGKGGKLIGEYFFRDLHLNPTFANDQFTVAALKP
ncbi:MAG: DUF1571 domain-containing protein [Planctomycetes bacterium]|nr:DUF1571 domain-containing protein [Planctomycetota bacterium]